MGQQVREQVATGCGVAATGVPLMPVSHEGRRFTPPAVPRFVGAGVPTAVVSAVLLERACRIQLLAMATGRDVRASDDAEALAKREHIYGDAPPRRAFDHLVRRLP
jgi:L-fuculose-phosphate aldolase